MGNLVSQCLSANSHYLNAYEKMLVRQSWSKVNLVHSDFRTKILSMSLPTAGKTGMAINCGLAQSMIALDPRFRAVMETNLNRTCELIDIVVFDAKVDHGKVTSAAESFAMQNVVTTQISLSTLGLLLSLIVAYIEKEVDASSLEIDDRHFRHEIESTTSFKLSFSVMVTDEQTRRDRGRMLAGAWRKLIHHMLACMAEKAEQHKKKIEVDSQALIAGRTSRRGSFFRRTSSRKSNQSNDSNVATTSAQEPPTSPSPAAKRRETKRTSTAFLEVPKTDF